MWRPIRKNSMDTLIRKSLSRVSSAANSAIKHRTNHLISHQSDPLTNVTVAGTNWLQQGSALNLQFKCTGSPPFEYCLHFSNKPFNSTGNRTCDYWQSIPTCEFDIVHFYYEAMPHYVLIIVRNQVTLINKELTIKVYNVTKQSQLSVIVVPIVFTLAAITLIIFGVAYYIQNKHQ